MSLGIKTAVLLFPLSVLIINATRLWQQLPLQAMSWPLTWLGRSAEMMDDYNCLHKYSIEILFIDPVVIYLKNFLKDEEVAHLLGLEQVNFRQSGVLVEDKSPVLDERIRSSHSGRVPRGDVVAECLDQRMQSILGNVQHAETEPLQIVKYEVGGEYRIHVDWFFAPQNETLPSKNETRRWNRRASIFAYLDDDCAGGETFFPELDVVETTRSDEYSVIRGGPGKGLYVKPRKGSAIFWNNLHPNGTGDLRVAHAGLPVQSGRKVGLNIWSKYFFFDEPVMEKSE